MLRGPAGRHRCDSPRGRRRLASATQQLDLDAHSRAGHRADSRSTASSTPINAVSATVRPDQLAQLRARTRGRRRLSRAHASTRRPPWPGISPRSGAAARPLAVRGATGRGVTVALLDGPVDASIPICTTRRPAGTRSTASRRTPSPAPVRGGARHGDGRDRRPARDGPAGLHGVAPDAHAAADPGARAAARRARRHDGDAARRHRPCARPERRRRPLRSRRRHPRAARRAVRRLRRLGRDGRGPRAPSALGAVLVAAAGNDGPTGARFGTVASPAASPRLARSRRDRRPPGAAERGRDADDGRGRQRAPATCRWPARSRR